ncbi:MAG TPA: hypothetical protein VJ276_16175, partial [Thermoanaerobaculia bacterium]|nr:hypothetical protein [Thermoanaerobaculia bacterium]
GAVHPSMLFAFLLALTLGGETPLADVRIGAPPQYIRSLAGAAPTADGGWLVGWTNGTTITIAPVGTDIRKQIGGIDAALASTARGPILLWSVNGGVFAAPLGADGSIIGTASRVAAFPSNNPLLACNATRCVAVTGLTTAILDADARVIASSTSTERASAVAADPNGFLVIRAPNSDIRAERLDASGAVLTTTTIPNSFSTAAADFDGQRYAIFYAAVDVSTLGVTLALDGTLGTPRAVYRPRIGAMDGISAAWNGSEHLLAVSDITELGIGIEGTIWPSVVDLVHLDRNLTATEPPSSLFNAPRSSYYPRAAAAGGRFYVTWQHTGVGSSVRGAEIAGKSITHSVFTTGRLSQYFPTLDAAEERDLATWLESDDAAGKTTLFYRRLPNDAAPRVLAEAYRITLQASTSVGSDWFAAWTESANDDLGRIEGAIISPFSDSVQRVDIGIRGWVEGIATGSNGWMLLVNTGGRLSTVRVTRSGQVLPAVEIEGSSGSDAAIASNGANFIVAVAHGDQGVDLFLLDGDGQVRARQHVNGPSIYSVAVTAVRRDFILATGGGSNGTSFWNVPSDLGTPQLKGRATGSAQTTRLVPFGSGVLAVWGATALRLDATGGIIGTPTTFDSPILAIAPHGNTATAIFGRVIDGAQQLFVREIMEPFTGRRRTLR